LPSSVGWRCLISYSSNVHAWRTKFVYEVYLFRYCLFFIHCAMNIIYICVFSYLWPTLITLNCVLKGYFIYQWI
jgi:hypothetical protein